MLFFHSGDEARTKKETKHTQKKKTKPKQQQNKTFTHPVSVIAGEVDLLQSASRADPGKMHVWSSWRQKYTFP